MPQASLPSPRTWSPADQVTVPRLRADVSDAVAFLSQRPYFVGQRTLGDSWASVADNALPMDSELTDFWGGHLAPPASGTSSYWAPVPGWYLVDARVPFNYTSTTPAPFMAGWQGLSNGTTVTPVHGAVTVNGSGIGTVTARAVDLFQMVNAGSPNGGGDYVQPLARQDSGSPVNLSSLATCLPTVSIRWACATSGTQPLPVPPLATVPSPITSAWLNANVRDAINFLTYPPALKVSGAGGSSLANSSLSSPGVVPMTSVALDNYGGWGSNRYTAPVSGRYLLAGQVNFVMSSTATTYGCGLLVNGSQLYWGGIVRFAGTSLAGGASVTRRLRLNAGDYVQLVAVQQTGGSLAYSTTTNNQTRFIALWEGI